MLPMMLSEGIEHFSNARAHLPDYSGCLRESELTVTWLLSFFRCEALAVGHQVAKASFQESVSPGSHWAVSLCLDDIGHVAKERMHCRRQPDSCPWETKRLLPVVSAFG